MSSGDFDPGECRVVDHDSETHQLRVLRTVPFDTALAPDDPRHFEVLLRSRVFEGSSIRTLSAAPQILLVANATVGCKQQFEPGLFGGVQERSVT